MLTHILYSIVIQKSKYSHVQATIAVSTSGEFIMQYSVIREIVYVIHTHSNALSTQNAQEFHSSLSSCPPPPLHAHTGGACHVCDSSISKTKCLFFSEM